eukprot:TRINITY_DN19868_c0_g1_i1.p1 TRINITY_DN19868_c0_g1~~TRINITY_DN19868_c0_g1_i1.p1  ORF type:complete len:172 (+),score=27.69 TRINITY_DN19868_c0_g1_i1:304-819(+)
MSAVSSRYMKPMRAAVTRGPRSFSFCMMWVPFPANMLPFLVGLVFTEREVPWNEFMAGALPSKWIHFGCVMVIGMEASSLSSALSHGSGSQQHGEQESSGAQLAAVVGSMVLTIGVLGYMILVMKREVSTMNLNGERERVDGIESGLESPLGSPVLRAVFATNPYARDIKL